MTKTKIKPAIAIPVLALAMLFASTALAHAQTGDFNIAATPLEVCVSPGGTAYFSTTASSTGGFQGTVSLGDTVDPASANGPTVSLPSTVSLANSQSVSFYVSVSTTGSTPTGTYTISVAGESGDTLHSATVYLAVQNVCPSLGGTLAQTDGIGLFITLATIGASVAGLGAGTAFLYGRRSRIR